MQHTWRGAGAKLPLHHLRQLEQQSASCAHALVLKACAPGRGARGLLDPQLNCRLIDAVCLLGTWPVANLFWLCHKGMMASAACSGADEACLLPSIPRPTPPHRCHHAAFLRCRAYLPSVTHPDSACANLQSQAHALWQEAARVRRQGHVPTMDDLSHLMTVPEESADPAVQRLAALSKGRVRMNFARQSLQGELGSGGATERIRVALTM